MVSVPRRLSLLSCSAALLVAPSALSPATPATASPVDVYSDPNTFEALAPALRPGDPAPALAVKEWLNGEPVDPVEKGRVTVVEFWATWCGPCRQSIPSLSALARRVRGLRVVGVAAAEEVGPEALRGFVGKRGSRMDYPVAYVDDDESTFKRWVRAARVSGLPWAFIVDREGRIAWWGQPFYEDFEPTLERVLAGTYDIEAARTRVTAGAPRSLRGWTVREEAFKALEATRT